MSAVVFLLHVQGNSPSKTDHWSKPYKSFATAKGQATKSTRYFDGTPYGDWTADVYRFDPATLTIELMP